jgi:hypothetical protein
MDYSSISPVRRILSAGLIALVAGKVKKFEVNGKQVNIIAKYGDYHLNNKLFIPEKELRVGDANRVDVYFENVYVTNGHGLHSYLDADGVLKFFGSS